MLARHDSCTHAIRPVWKFLASHALSCVSWPCLRASWGSLQHRIYHDYRPVFAMYILPLSSPISNWLLKSPIARVYVAAEHLVYYLGTSAVTWNVKGACILACFDIINDQSRFSLETRLETWSWNSHIANIDMHAVDLRNRFLLLGQAR